MTKTVQYTRWKNISYLGVDARKPVEYLFFSCKRAADRHVRT